jgi:ABC-type dipeptide/oligopeptide/nickel transport system permease component
VIYAYLLAITLLVLDVVYAIVDPRVKFGAGISQA